MPTVNTFDLRRTHASWLIQAGVRNDLVAKVLGHTTTVMVDRVYGKYDPHHLKALIERNLAGVPEVYLPGVPQTPELPEKDPQNGP